MRNLVCRLIVLVTLGLTVALSVSSVEASLTLSVEQVEDGGQHFLQFLLTSSVDGPNQNLAFFGITIDPDTSQLSFTGNVDDQTDPAYVFGGVSGGILLEFLEDNTYFLNDFVFGGGPSPPTHVTVLAGSTVGLGRVEFEFTGTATNILPFIAIVDRDFLDEFEERIEVGLAGSSEASIVPEPGTFTLFMLGLASVIPGTVVRRRSFRKLKP